MANVSGRSGRGLKEKPVSSVAVPPTPTTDGRESPETFRGWLLKWTNYIKGYQKRWFVLANGLLSYYRTQEEMAHTCRGTINLAGAVVDSLSNTDFVVANGQSQVFYLRALNEIERQRWVTALELAKARAIKNLEDVSDEEKEDVEPLKELAEKLSELSTSHDIIVNRHHDLIKAINDFEAGKDRHAVRLKERVAMFKITADAMTKMSSSYYTSAQSTKQHWERALSHQRSLSHQLQENFEALAKQMHGLENQARRASKQGMNLNGDTGRSELDESFHFPVNMAATPDTGSTVSSVSSLQSATILSQQPSNNDDNSRPTGRNNKKEVSFNLPTSSPSPEPTPIFVTSNDGSPTPISEIEDDDDQFYDAEEGGVGENLLDGHKDMLSLKKTLHKRTESSISMNEPQTGALVPKHIPPENLPASSGGGLTDRFKQCPPGFMDNVQPTIANRRTHITPRPNVKLSLWSIMKNCIGKELSKIPMPVHFSEPLSFLQRVGEDITGHGILDKAACCTNTLEEMAHVAAFAISAYESTAIRIFKPFNPMLGETFELDRRAEEGFRLLFEQVSHHPPMLAMHCEHKDWTFWQEYTLASKFRGKYLQCFPIGGMHIIFHRSGSHYTWNKVVVTIHNIIVGKLWVDNAGDMNMVNHTTGEKCPLKFHQYSYFARERQRKVTGHCLDKDGVPRFTVRGYWDEYAEYAPVISSNDRDVQTGEFQELWRVEPRPPDASAMYHFSHFTASLNEMEPGIAPTDSRWRPDQRTMEGGDFDEANRIKVLLEEKQRERRRKREAIQARAAEAASQGDQEEADRLEREAAYHPVWFRKEFDPYLNQMLHVYKGGYWEMKETGNWDQLGIPNIFET